MTSTLECWVTFLGVVIGICVGLWVERRQKQPPTAGNLGNFLRTLATPEPIKDWSMTSLKEKLIKIGAKVVRHGRYIAFQMAEVAISRHLIR
jgi:hypothetical protein